MPARSDGSPAIYRAHPNAWGDSSYGALFPVITKWPKQLQNTQSARAASIQNPQYTNLTTVAKRHWDVILAVLGYLQGKNNAIADENKRFTLVKVGNGVYASEQAVRNSNGDLTGEYVLSMIGSNGDFRAAIANSSDAYSPLPTLGAMGNPLEKYPLDGMFAMFLMRTCELVKEARDDLALLEQTLAISGMGGTDELDENEPLLELYRLCDAVYFAIKTGALKVPISGGNIDPLLGAQVRTGTYFGTILSGPTPKILFGANASKVKEKTNLTLADAKSMFAEWRNQQHWTAEDRQFIADYPDDYPIPPEAIQIAKLFVSTQKSKRPMVNFMWRGITSYGKSTGVELMSAMLDMPLLRMTCNSNMETQQFLSDFVPDSGQAYAGTLPNIDDILGDPEAAYEELTGEVKPDATLQDCLDAFAAAVEANARAASNAKYKIVESNFVKALRKGYICEVQELSRIRDAGVMVGLNEYDRPGSRIPMVDGSFVLRHPHAMVVYTDNVGYASCRPIDPSVLRRMAFIIDSYELPKEAALDRVKYNTGFADEDVLDKMYDLWESVKDYCEKKEITEGSVSVTELEMWCQAVLADGMSNLKLHCQRCVVAKATSVIEEQKDICASVVDISPLF